MDRYYLLIVSVLVSTILLSIACGTSGSGSGLNDQKIDIEAFKTLARNANCTAMKNNLFIIDSKLVFWERAGGCPDAGYGFILYGTTPDQILCVYGDSIAGPRKTIHDKNYEQLFETIIKNIKEPDLGLSPQHNVKKLSLNH